MRISDWSSDVCSSDLPSGSMRRPSGLEKVSPSISPTRLLPPAASDGSPALRKISQLKLVASGESPSSLNFRIWPCRFRRSEEHTSELQSLMRISYAVFCLKKKKHKEIRSDNAIKLT